MTTVHERNFPRLRALAQFLAKGDGRIDKDDAFAHVAATMPPTEEDLGTVPTGRTRWINDLLWQTTPLTRPAGW